MDDAHALDCSFESRAGALPVSFEAEIRPGEVVVLVGPNGSGKSTCVRTICGLHPAASGAVSVAGRLLFSSAAGVDIPPWKRELGVMLSGESLMPHLTLRANLVLGLPASRCGGSLAWLESLGLGARLENLPAQLSSGERQRAALARAFSREAPLILLDEPFAALDPAARNEARACLRGLLGRANEAGRRPGVLLVTHDHMDAASLGDRIIVMEQGRVVERGTWDDLARRPRSDYLAAFTGHNVIRGICDSNAAEGDSITFIAAGAQLAGTAVERLRAGPVLAQFDPSDVLLARENLSVSARVRLPATVEGTTRIGSRVRVYLDAGFPVSSDVTDQAAAELSLEAGARLFILIKSTSISVYNRSGAPLGITPSESLQQP